MSLAWTALYVWFFRNTPIEHKWMTAKELEEIGVDTVRMKSAAKGKTPWKEMIQKMWLVTFVDFCYGWSLWVFLTWLPSYLKDARGFDLKQLALFTSLPLLAGVVGDTLGGVVSDFIYKRTGNLKTARRAMLVIGMGGALVFIVPVVGTENPMMAVALLAASFFFLELTWHDEYRFRCCRHGFPACLRISDPNHGKLPSSVSRFCRTVGSGHRGCAVYRPDAKSRRPSGIETS